MSFDGAPRAIPLCRKRSAKQAKGAKAPPTMALVEMASTAPCKNRAPGERALER